MSLLAFFYDFIQNYNIAISVLGSPSKIISHVSVNPEKCSIQNSYRFIQISFIYGQTNFRQTKKGMIDLLIIIVIHQVFNTQDICIPEISISI